MYRGFPVGYLLFWANSTPHNFQQIGLEEKGHKIPALLIVDGQQRLTSLYSVIRGKPVLDDNFQERRLKIAFRPRDGRFEVSDAAIEKDPEFIPDISVLWTSGKAHWGLVNDFLKRLEAKTPLTEEEKNKIAHNLDRLFDLEKYPFTALEIVTTVDEEQVADIFVRINSQGVNLGQGDFILTLLSVFAEDLRVELERFSRACHQPPKPAEGPSPYNHFQSAAGSALAGGGGGGLLPGPLAERVSALAQQGSCYRRIFSGKANQVIPTPSGKPTESSQPYPLASVFWRVGGGRIQKRPDGLLPECPALCLCLLPHWQNPLWPGQPPPGPPHWPLVLRRTPHRPLHQRAGIHHGERPEPPERPAGRRGL